MKRRMLITWISGTTERLSEQDPANVVRGAGDTKGLGRVKLLRSQLGISFSSCRMTMVSMTKNRPHGNQRVCSWVMNGARSKCRATAMPPLVTKSKLEQGNAEGNAGRWQHQRRRKKINNNYEKSALVTLLISYLEEKFSIFLIAMRYDGGRFNCFYFFT